MISTSYDGRMDYMVENISEDNLELILSSPFNGNSSSGDASLIRVQGGRPYFHMESSQLGSDEFVYDLFFSGGYWRNMLPPQVNVFGDGTCTANLNNIQDGMNRGIANKTIIDGGMPSDGIVLSEIYHGDVLGRLKIYNAPTLHTVHKDTSEIQQIIVKDMNNTSIWSVNTPSFKLAYLNESTPCIAYNSTALQVERIINDISTLCPEEDSCVSVTRSLDASIAPNGFLFTLHFKYGSLANKNIPDPYEGGFEGNLQDLECTPFSYEDGEFLDLSTIVQGRTTEMFSPAQIPLGNMNSASSKDVWRSESADNLSIYRVSGKGWEIKYDNVLGNLPSLTCIDDTLSNNSVLKVFKHIEGVNSQRAIVDGLSQGVPYYFRVKAQNSVGVSVASETQIGIAGSIPRPLTGFTANHVLHENEVQLITVTASYTNEVQKVTTGAAEISEVQRIELSNDIFAIRGGSISLRHPEVQVVEWSSSSEVTEGSFYIKLILPDIDESLSLSQGKMYTKTLKTPCIEFNASAEDFKNALEHDALENGFDVGEIEVKRNRLRENTSKFGYSYTISFVGDSVKGNINQFSTDVSLSGLDSSGGMTCKAFNSDDAYVVIKTLNDDMAMGTDTPRAVVELTSNTDIVEGEYALEINYLGQVMTSECISWDADPAMLEDTLEKLDNVDAVHVVSRKRDTFVEDFPNIIFHCVNGSNILQMSEMSSNHLVELKIGDRIYVDHQERFFIILTISSNNLMLSEPYVGHDKICSVTKAENYIYDVHFNGQGMHNTSNYEGFLVENPNSFSILTVNSCTTFKAWINGSLKEFSQLPDAKIDVSIHSRYDGGHTIPALNNASVSTAVISDLMHSSFAYLEKPFVTSSLEDYESGVTYTIKFDQSDGDLPSLVCNVDSEMKLMSTSCIVHNILDGNELSGSFFLNSSSAIAFDASADEMKMKMEQLPNVGIINVTCTPADAQGGRSWSITFKTSGGDVGELIPHSSLFGKNASVVVYEETKGNEVGGTFILSYENMTTGKINTTSEASVIQRELRSLQGLENVQVSGATFSDVIGSSRYWVTFISPTLGDVPLLQVNISGLIGSGSTATVFEKVKGSIASSNALIVTYETPHYCSISPVNFEGCGAPLTSIQLEIDDDLSMNEPQIHSIEPDFTIQKVRTASPSFGARQFQRPSISGSFTLSYGSSTTSDLAASATSHEVRIALENLPEVETVSVERDFSRSIYLKACISAKFGSSQILCESSCECAFGSNGLKANDLITLDSYWFRVASSYNGTENTFNLALADNSKIACSFPGKDSDHLTLFKWAGGFEWMITFHKVRGRVKQLKSSRHNLNPNDSNIGIGIKNCDKCIMVKDLIPWKPYFLRATAVNSFGHGLDGEIILATPKGKI